MMQSERKVVLYPGVSTRRPTIEDYTLYRKPWFYKSGKARELAKLMYLGLLALLLTGCMTTYEVVKQTPEGDVRVVVKSFREFEQPQIHYSRQGDDVVFDFGAESATTGGVDMGAVRDIVEMGVTGRVGEEQ